MRLISNDFQPGGMIPHMFTCDGEDLSPHLAWDDVPEGTKSFALAVDDPDAPGGTWVHWLVADVSANLREIPRGTLPAGAKQLRNDFGKLNYGGPCPPGGTHRYFFRLYALDTKLLTGINERNFYEMVEKHKLDVGILMGKYSRR